MKKTLNILLFGLMILVCTTKAPLSWADSPTSTSSLPLSQTLKKEVGSHPVRITVSIDEDQVRVADPFELKVEVTAPDELSIVFPDFSQAAVGGDFAILRNRVVGPIPIIEQENDSPDRYKKTVFLEMESHRSGEQTIAPFAISIIGAESELTLSTLSLPIAIVGLVPADQDPTHFRELKPIVTLAETGEVSTSWRWWLPGGVLVMMAGLVAFKRYRSSGGQQLKQWIAKIDQVEARHADQSIDLISAQDEVCEGVKRWIQWKEQIPAVNLATGELMGQLRERAWPDPVLQRLETLLSQNDQQKFSPSSDAEPLSPCATKAMVSVFDEARWLMGHSMPPAGPDYSGPAGGYQNRS